MTEPTAQQVEAAVREVLAGLGHGHGHGPRRSPLGALHFEGRLFALGHAEALASGVLEVRLAPGTVITPMARDELKRRGIAVRFVSPGEAGRPGLEGEWGFAIDDDSGVMRALGRALLDGPDDWIDVGPGPLGAAHWVVESPGRGAVLVSPEASVAAWAANQIAGVRGATVADVDAVARAARHLGANLLVIEPAGKSIPWLKQMFATFRRAGAPAPPAWLGGGPPIGPGGHADRRGDRPGDALEGPPQPPGRPVRAGLADAARGPDFAFARPR